MPYGRARSLQQVQSFIKKTLPERLRKDLCRLRILREADAACAAYFYLRRFLGEDSNWKVFASLTAPATGYRPDLLLFQNTRPVLAIEMKWNRNLLGEKDRASLEGALQKLGVNKAYWISLLKRNRFADRLIRRDSDRYVLHQIVITPGFTDKTEYAEWLKSRESYRDGMQSGRGVRRKKDRG